MEGGGGRRLKPCGYGGKQHEHADRAAWLQRKRRQALRLPYNVERSAASGDAAYNDGGEGVEILLGRVAHVHAMMAGDHLGPEGFSAPTPAPPGRGAGWWELVEFCGGFLGRVVKTHA